MTAVRLFGKWLLESHFLLLALSIAGSGFVSTASAADETPNLVRFIPAQPIMFADRAADGTILDPAASLVKDGSLSGDVASILIDQLVKTIRNTDPTCDANKSSFLINIVVFGSYDALTSQGQMSGFPVALVQSSNWYAYEPKHQSFVTASSGQTARVYGATTTYVIVIHLHSDNSAYQMAYQDTMNHRTPTSLQDLEDALTLFKALVKPPGAAAPVAPPAPVYKDFWTWGRLLVNTPANIAITAGIAKPGSSPSTTKDITALEKTPAQFDDNGFYHWDISVGVPITSYTQLQNVKPESGTIPVPANVDRRNLILVGDFYVKPADLEGTRISYIPYVVGGISFASKPLHNVMAGAGIGPTTAGLYVGTMIVTDNLSNGRKNTHVKLAFGLNFPVRAIMSKLGVNTQVSSGTPQK